MNKKLTVIALIITLNSANIVLAANNYNYTPAQTQPVYTQPVYPQPAQTNTQYLNNNTLKGSVIMVPAGVSVGAMLVSPLSSQNAVVGQNVNLILNNEFSYGGKLIAPAGSTVVGTIIEASKAKHGSMNGKLSVRFTQINTPYGTQIPISAVIKTDDGSGVLVGGTKMDVAKEYTKDIAKGSAAGALSGLVFGALAGGDKLGRGVALGTAIGAGGGLVKSFVDKGVDVEIPTNANIELLLTQPVTVTSSNYYYEN